MKISVVSKIISRIQFTVYSLFAFFISIAVITYILLSNGITISHLNLPNFKVDQLYIKLDKKLSLSAKKIDVTLGNTLDTANNPDIHSYIKYIAINFHSLRIDELSINNHKVTFSYNESSDIPSDNHLSFVNEVLQATLNYTIQDNIITLKMPSTKHTPSGISVRAKGIIDLKKNTGHAIVTASATKNDDLKIYIKENDTALAFSSNAPVISNFASIVDLFKLEDNVSKWIVDYNQAQKRQLVQFKGVIEYLKPQTIQNSLFIHAREMKPVYTFNEKLAPLQAESADVYYSKGILKIRPTKPTYNKHQLDEGSVDIDFNNEHIMLGVRLKTDTRITQDIVDIVSAYDVSLPVLQKTGSAKASLILDIDLTSEKTFITGDVYIKESELLLHGTQYKVKDTDLIFNNDYLALKKADLNYQDMFFGKVNGLLDFKSLSGNFFFNVNKVDLANTGYKGLKLLDKNLRIHLNFSDDAENYIIAKSNWSLFDYNLTATSTKITLPNKSGTAGKIKTLKLHIPQIGDVDINGTLEQAKANLNINLIDFNYKSKDIKLSTSKKKFPIQLSYDKNIAQLHLATNSSLKLNGMPLDIAPTTVLIKDGYVQLDNTLVQLKDKFSSHLSLRYKLGSNGARLDMKNTKFFTGEYLHIKPKFTLFYNYEDTKHTFHINKYNMHATVYDKNIFALNVKEIAKLYPHSEMMKKYDLKSGSANLVFMGNRTEATIKLKEFHPLLSKDGKDISTYTIEGTYKNNVSNIRINKSLDLIYGTKGKLIANDIDFNLFPILSYLKHINTNDNKSDLDLSVETKNCNVSLGYSKRKILADNISMKITPSNIEARLNHKKGGVIFKSHDDNFSVYGNGLDDSFMNSLFKFSRFEGGELYFSMQGRFDEFEGFIKTNNTIMKGYTVLNNTLAFFNTIPSLVTFSVPGYSSKGIKVKEMYATFHKKDSKVFIDDAKILSKELVITAKGESDLSKETIDVLIDVKTDIGSSVKDIPLVGYIIFGEDTISTSVRVRGDLKDPEVESVTGITNSIIQAPYNIIKRTIGLPLKLLDLFDDDEGNKTK